ncbi:TetR/AcrR family transcriptional regulator [Streptomyces sp. PmtG]
MTGTTRRRPTHRKGRATLTREGVGEAALAYLGKHGAEALTMRALAAELGVSARALYHYVADRRDLVTVAAEIFQATWRPPRLDAGPESWRRSLRAFCDDLRAHYRRHPGMTTLALRENITLAHHPAMLRNVDALIGFYAGVGLAPADAYRACMETIRLVVGFVEFEDAVHDRPPAHLDPADLTAHPPPWLRTADADALPHLAGVAALAPDDADARFAFAVDVLTEGIAARCA